MNWEPTPDRLPGEASIRGGNPQRLLQSRRHVAKRLTSRNHNQRPSEHGRWGLGDRPSVGCTMLELSFSVKLTVKQAIQLAQAVVWIIVLLLT